MGLRNWIEQGRLMSVPCEQKEPARGFVRLADGRLMETEDGQPVGGPIPEPLAGHRHAEYEAEAG